MHAPRPAAPDRPADIVVSVAGGNTGDTIRPGTRTSSSNQPRSLPPAQEGRKDLRYRLVHGGAHLRPRPAHSPPSRPCHRTCNEIGKEICSFDVSRFNDKPAL